MEVISTHRRRLWFYDKFLRSIFSKSTQPFDFIKPNAILKLTLFDHVFTKFENTIFWLESIRKKATEP